MTTIDMEPDANGVYRPITGGGGTNGGGPTGPHAGASGDGNGGSDNFSWAEFLAAGRSIFDHYAENWKRLESKLILAAFIAIVIGWLANIFYMEGFNLIPFLGMGSYIAIKGFSLGAIAASLGLGGASGWLRDKDVSQGMVRGTGTLVHVVWGFLFYTWLTFGFLASWSFADSWSTAFSFWYVFCFGLLILAAMRFYAWPGETLPYIVVGYSAVVIFITLWGTISDDVERATGFNVHVTEEERAEAAAAADARAERREFLRMVAMQPCHDDYIPTRIPATGEWMYFPNPARCNFTTAREEEPHADWETHVYIAGHGWSVVRWDGNFIEDLPPNLGFRIRHIGGEPEYFYAWRPEIE